MGQRARRGEPEGHDYDDTCRCDHCENIRAVDWATSRREAAPPPPALGINYRPLVWAAKQSNRN